MGAGGGERKCPKSRCTETERNNRGAHGVERYSRERETGTAQTEERQHRHRERGTERDVSSKEGERDEQAAAVIHLYWLLNPHMYKELRNVLRVQV